MTFDVRQCRRCGRHFGVFRDPELCAGCEIIERSDRRAGLARLWPFVLTLAAVLLERERCAGICDAYANRHRKLLHASKGRDQDLQTHYSDAAAHAEWLAEDIRDPEGTGEP